MVREVGEIETSREGGVLTITLNRPDVLNALNGPMHAGLAAALDDARDPLVRAVLLIGAGRGFCVGQDLQEFRAGAGDVAASLRERFNRHVLAIRSLEKPVVAAVNGPAAGAGLSLALACDARLAADTATFVPAFIGIGLVPDTGGTWLARRLLGTARAFEWLTTNRRLTAAEALQWGLVSEVVPAGELAERASEVAALFAAMPTRAVWETKRLLDTAESSTLEEQLEDEAWTQAELVKTEDFTEGVAAFIEKREPAFGGQAPDPFHPVRLVVRDDLRRFRLTVLLRLLLALPHFVLSTLWLYLAVLVAIVQGVVIVVRGRPHAGMHAWTARFLRYFVHAQAYTWLVADPFPRFRGYAGTYPIDLDVAPPGPQSRWTTAFRVVLGIPAYILAYVLSLVLQVVSLIGWFAALALGRMPRGMRDLMAYCLRYQAQTYAYLLLLTGRYPSLASGSGFQFEEGSDVRSTRP
jgi:2-(1,2-epoxy-1,2-dihydrophenyl)acetyl-CoA isomerase